MRIISDKLKEHINSEVTTIATCVKLTLKSGKELVFTDCDSDINFEGLIYKARNGFNPSSLVATNDLSADNLDLNMIIDNDEIIEDDILSGLYDHSEVEIFLINYEKPYEGIIKLTKGFIGEITINKGRFTAEVRGISYKLNKLIGQLYSPVCRAKFTDRRCGVNQKKYLRSGNITKIENIDSFIDDNRNEEAGYFNFGIIEFPEIGIKLEIKNFFNKKIECFLPLPTKLNIGDKYIIMPGCDKSFFSCKNKYQNSMNFRGEPHIPGNKYMFSSN